MEQADLEGCDQTLKIFQISFHVSSPVVGLQSNETYPEEKGTQKNYSPIPVAISGFITPSFFFFIKKKKLF